VRGGQGEGGSDELHTSELKITKEVEYIGFC
jgi:hypothetical protein